MEKFLTIGKTIQILTNTINLTSFTEAEGVRFYDSNKHKILRMKDFDVSNMNKNDLDNYLEYIKKVDTWSAWATDKGYLKGYQQTAMSDFYLLLFQAAAYNMPLDKNMTEHFFSYALAKVLFNQISEYMDKYPSEDKYYAIYYCLATFELFGDDERYLKDYNPIESIFVLLSHWVKDINQLITFWEDQIAEKGLRDSPLNLHSYINKWKKGTKISWENVKLFFDENMIPPEEFFIDNENIRKDGYKTFKTSLFLGFIISNLFEYLVKEEIISEESLKMIKDGARLYYRDFYVIRKEGNPEHSDDFEEEAKNNLMFKTMFLMLDGNMSQLSLLDYLNFVYQNPEFPILNSIPNGGVAGDTPARKGSPQRSAGEGKAFPSLQN